METLLGGNAANAGCGSAATAVGGVAAATAGAALSRVALAQALTYSATKIKSQKEERCIAVKN